MVAPGLCVVCKGANLCGRRACPLLAALRRRGAARIKKEFFGPSISVFVGRSGYPDVKVGPVAVIGDDRKASLLEDPKSLFGLELEDILELRSLTLRADKSESVFSRGRLVGALQEIALASEPVDVELDFAREPRFGMRFSDLLQPVGATATLEKLRVVGNPKIPRVVERVVSDDLRAAEAVGELYDSGLDVYKISTILASGALGSASPTPKRRLVPTRWSITATDDIVFKHLIHDVRNRPQIDEFRVYEACYMDNHFVILLRPSAFEYENFEAWAPGSTWYPAADDSEVGIEAEFTAATAAGASIESDGGTQMRHVANPVILHEYEGFRGRKRYASQEGGGYYAARLAVAEFLHRIRRQAGVVVFREVYEGYVLPLGVWVVRETVRQALKRKPQVFETEREALEYVDSRLRLGLEPFAKKSVILGRKRLSDYHRCV
ncbi:MAG: Nre family DNA repair protein [Candidatus Alkanophagales archaeon]